MNNYESLFYEILTLTRSEQLCWHQIGRKENAEIILNPHLVIRQFASDMRLEGNVLGLLLLERRHLYNEEDFFIEPLEERRAELLVLAEGELIASLTEMSVRLARMMELLDLAIDQSNRSLLVQPA